MSGSFYGEREREREREVKVGKKAKERKAQASESLFILKVLYFAFCWSSDSTFTEARSERVVVVVQR